MASMPPIAVVQNLEDAGLPALLLTYISNSLFVVLLPVAALARRPHAGQQQAAQPASPGKARWSEEADKLVEQRTASSTAVPGAERTPSSLGWRATLQDMFADRRIMKAAAVHAYIMSYMLQVAPLWFMAQFTFNTSLSRTTVSSNTILASTASLVTYIMSCLLLGEAFLVVKLASILVCMAGTAMVTLGDSRSAEGRSSVTGDLLVLCSSLFYGCYTIAIRRMMPDSNGGASSGHSSVALLFGLVGLLNMVCLAPLLLILMWAAVIDASQVTAGMLGLNVLKGLFDNVLSDYLWARAVLLIGPTIATVGLSVQIPLAVVAEMLLKSPPWLRSASSAVLILLGALAVIAGFLGVTLTGQTTSLDATQVVAPNDSNNFERESVAVDDEAELP
eukprot:jgi/Astpho2/7549/Aster-02457